MNLQQCYALKGAQVAGKVIDGEAIIMNLADGSYYSLEGSGALIWEGLQAGRTLRDILDLVTGRYEVAGERAEADLLRLTAELVTEGLLVPSAVPNSPGQAPEPASGGTRGDYQTPAYEKYTDMADLLALDPPNPGFDETPWARADAPGPD